MRELPIFFKPWKIKVIQEWDFEKQGPMQTRRVMKPQPGIAPGIGEVWKGSDWDEEWVREAPYQPGDHLWVKERLYAFKFDTRLWLEVLNVRVERVQEISEEDARAEGVNPCPSCDPNDFKYRHGFKNIWDDIYKKKPEYQWEANPWVWVYEFKERGA